MMGGVLGLSRLVPCLCKWLQGCKAFLLSDCPLHLALLHRLTFQLARIFPFESCYVRG